MEGFPRIRWRRILLTSLLASVLTVLLLASVAITCVLTVAWWIEGPQDHAQAKRLVQEVIDWAVPLVGALSAAASVAWVSRKMRWTANEHGETLRKLQMKLEIHGLLVGMVLGALGLALYLDRPHSLPALASLVLPLGSGWLGAVWGAPKTSVV